ncbi:kinase-like protein [Thelephora ganbajun]|uniref:Kinase-like protein n=1 Tax=Thelephora ganbajun TaxID=370292 RepID=A0ACB6ZGY9_THEGA|nr:kinase-like protein [Thelephora ganbajun]
MDEALHTTPGLSLWPRKKCLKLLYRTCGHHKLVPTTLKIPICCDRTSNVLYRSGFADVWKVEHCGRDVAVKAIRTYSNSDLQKVIGRFCKEVVTWKFLRHPNVLPLLGVTMSEHQFAMISDWVANGNINDFVKAYPGVDRLGLLVGVAEGLIYIHGQEMIHGNLKGANILIDQTGNARLADFGLLTIISDPANLLSSSSYTQGGTARWMSPELIDPQRFGFEKNRPTRSSDCYALGMVIYETISGNLPFHEHANLTVFMKVMEGKHPTRRVRFPEGLWKMLELCWSSHPDNRPSIGDVLWCLEMVSNVLEPPPLGLDEEIEENDDWDSESGHSAKRPGFDTQTPDPYQDASTQGSVRHQFYTKSLRTFDVGSDILSGVR